MSSQQLRVLLEAKPVNTLEWRAWGLLSPYPEGGAMNNWLHLGAGSVGCVPVDRLMPIYTDSTNCTQWILGNKTKRTGSVAGR